MHGALEGHPQALAELRGAGGPRGASASLGRAGHLGAGLRRGRHAGQRAAHEPASEDWKSEILKPIAIFREVDPDGDYITSPPPKKT